MSKAIPPVQKYMSFNPHCIQADQPIHDAQDIMKQQNIRHLPVMQGEELYGILSDRDIRLALSLISTNAETTCGKICHTDFYAVDPDTKLDIICTEMAEHHYGSTVVIQNDKLVGIFTATDSFRALVDLAHQKFHH